MNERPTTKVSAGIQYKKQRVVAHLEYPLPHINGDMRFNSIITACVNGRWVAGYDVTTKSFGFGVGVCATFLKTFNTEYSAVYNAIREIRAQVAGIGNEEDRAFALRLCDLAYDEINPKLF